MGYHFLSNGKLVDLSKLKVFAENKACETENVFQMVENLVRKGGRKCLLSVFSPFLQCFKSCYIQGC